MPVFIQLTAEKSLSTVQLVAAELAAMYMLLLLGTCRLEAGTGVGV